MTSRLIVKGLPSNCTEARLRALFSPYGEITDCSLKYTKDGKFRCFAFVGFTSENSAKSAISRLNDTHFGSSRITVEECKPFGDATKPRAWSKYSKDSSAYKRAHTDDGSCKVGKDSSIPTKMAKLDKQENRKELSSATKKQVNDKDTSNIKKAIERSLELQGFLRENDTSLAAVLFNLPSTMKQKNLKEWLNPIRVKSLKIFRNEEEATAAVKFQKQGDLKRILGRDGEFLGGFKITIKDASKIYGMADGTVENNESLSNRVEAEAESCRNEILETGRLFVRNLPYSCVEDDLIYLFKKYGEIAEMQVMVNKKTNLCKGFAIVTYVFPENAVTAYSALDGTVFKGRMLHILPGAEKKEKSLTSDGSEKKSSFQKEKMLKLKKNAGKGQSWNTLFLGANAIADTLAERLKVEKSELLSSEGETSAGVRLALGETRLVRETRDFLLEHGVCLDAFSRPSEKRSNTVIIVKNLPANVSVDELERMFGRFDSSNKVILPPGGVTAIVEMSNTADARNAFNALAYSRFRTQPLYLEWAPIDVFNKKDEASGGPKSEEQNDNAKAVKVEEKEDHHELTAEEKKALRRSKKRREKEVEHQAEVKSEDNGTRAETAKDSEVDMRKESGNNKGIEEADEDEVEMGAGTSVFVKNLDFNTTEESLERKFSSKYRVKKAVISKKLDIKNPSQSLSMGFGFVQFYRASDAQDAIKTMQGTLLDGHSLELKLSNRDDSAKLERPRKGVSELEQKNRTKIHVKNIPFQASRKELQQLFATFGELRAFRLPRKAGASADSHRGFGFVDYLTVADARRAFNELSHSTHLYGKRLVLEWAKTDDDIEDLREKALSNVSAKDSVTSGRKKKLKEIEKDLATIDDD